MEFVWIYDPAKPTTSNSTVGVKCNNTGQRTFSKNPIFSYSNYSSHIKARFDKEREERLSYPHKRWPIDHFSDAVLKQELFSLYGEMDESDNKFKLIFRNYKAERLEQISEWIADEMNFLQPDSLQAAGNDDSGSFLSSFLSEEDEYYPRVLPSDLKDAKKTVVLIDPFLLPRRKKSGKERKQKPKGLTHFDSEVEISAPNTRKAKDGKGPLLKNQNALISHILDVINDHPVGISSDLFVGELKRHDRGGTGYWTYRTVEDLVKSQNFIVSKPTPALGSVGCNILYYPSSVKEFIAPPLEILETVWHKMKIVVNMRSGICKLRKVFNVLEMIFGWNVRLSFWGFGDPVQLTQFIINHWREPFQLISQDQIKRNGRRDIWYLVSVSNRQEKELLKSSLMTSVPSYVRREKPNDKEAYKKPKALVEEVWKPKITDAAVSASGLWRNQVTQGHVPQRPALTTSASPKGTPYNPYPQKQQQPQSLSSKICDKRSGFNNAFPELGAEPTTVAKQPSFPSPGQAPSKPKTWNKLF